MKLGLMRDLHVGQRHPGVIVSYVAYTGVGLQTDN